jgi:hypothetical protein
MLSIFIVYLICLGLGWLEFVVRQVLQTSTDTSTRSGTAFSVDCRRSGSVAVAGDV